jgi:hypothetical protein
MSAIIKPEMNSCRKALSLMRLAAAVDLAVAEADAACFTRRIVSVQTELT